MNERYFEITSNDAGYNISPSIQGLAKGQLLKGTVAGMVNLGIPDPQAQNNFIYVMKQAKSHLDKIEEERAITKKPFLDACKNIDTVAAHLSVPFEESYQSLQEKVEDYQMKERVQSMLSAQKGELYEIPRSEGMVVKEGWDIEVEDIDQACFANPQFFKRILKKEVILKYLEENPTENLPGLIIKKVVNVSVRNSNG